MSTIPGTAKEICEVRLNNSLSCRDCKFYKRGIGCIEWEWVKRYIPAGQRDEEMKMRRSIKEGKNGR